MNFRDVELMQNALQSAGDNALKRRQLEQQHQQQMAEMAMRSQMLDLENQRSQQVQSRYDKMIQLEQDRATAAQDRATSAERAANAPKVKAWLPDPTQPNNPAAGMQFEGSVDQYNQYLDAAKQKGYTVTPLSAPPASIASKEPVATYKVGGVTHSFWDESKAQQFEDGLREKGIDPYQGQTKTGETTTYKYDDNGKPISRITKPLGEEDTADNAPENNTPALPTSVKDTRGIFGRLFNTGQVPVPQPTEAPPISLTPDDLKVVPNPNLPQGAGITPQTQSMSDMVRVQHPDGRTGSIPRANLQQAIASGFKPLDDPSAEVPGVGSAQQ